MGAGDVCRSGRLRAGIANPYALEQGYVLIDAVAERRQHRTACGHVVAEAFGGDVPADRNPVNTIDQLPTTTRYRIVASPEDTWVVESQNSDRLAAGLQARGAEATVFQVHGTHDDPSHFDVDDLVRFATSCEDAESPAGDGTVSASP